MSAYIVVQVATHDQETMHEYMEQAWPTSPPYGAEALVADDHPEILEGEWFGPRTVILRFPTRERALAWYESAEYQAAAKLRFSSATSNFILCSGLDDA